MFGHRLISHSSKLRYLETAHDCLIGVIALNNAFFGLFGGILKLDPYHPIPMCVFIGSYWHDHTYLCCIMFRTEKQKTTVVTFFGNWCFCNILSWKSLKVWSQLPIPTRLWSDSRECPRCRLLVQSWLMFSSRRWLAGALKQRHGLCWHHGVWVVSIFFLSGYCKTQNLKNIKHQLKTRLDVAMEAAPFGWDTVW